MRPFGSSAIHRPAAPPASLENLGQTGFYPPRQGRDPARDSGTQGTELILHMRRHDRIGNALDKPVRFESLQRLRQHFLADTSDEAPQLAEPLPTLT
jgi:hypothetical protein